MESQFTNITESTANIKGSKGDIYSINFIEQTCTCADFVYRKSKSPINSDNRLCKHLRQWFDTHKKPKESILKELANRYLLIKDYKNALGALNAMSYSLDLKKAMIYIKLNEFTKAASIIKKLKKQTQTSKLS